jgi:hypothetical protein
MSITSNFPAIKPTLLLDFANTKQLDSRITFTRASTATYYGTQTAKAEENLLTRSQDFNLWTLSNVTVGTDTDTAPDGTTTAEAIKEDSATAVHRIQQPAGLSLAASSVYTISIFVKQKTGSRFATIGFTSDFSNYASATFDLSAGTNTQTLSAGYTSVSATITASVSSWYRVTLTATTNASASATGLALIGLSATSTFASSSRGFDSYAGNNTSEILYWGAQLEQRSAVTAYTPTTTQAITNYVPQILTAASGVARFDHNPTTFESLGLEIEESRTNLLTYSEQFDNAAWTKTNLTITANTIVSPDGALTGDKLIVDSGVAFGSGFTRQNITKAASATTYTSTVYAKAGEFNRVRFLCRDAASSANSASVTISLVDGSVVVAVAATGTFTSASSSATSVGNGWYRIALTFTSGTETAIWGGSYIPSDSVATQGNGYSGIYIWGAQLEEGAFATSYIPTVASQVTRAVDAASMTGTNFSSWYNQAEGTFFAQFIPASSSFGANKNLFLSSDGTANNYAGLRYTGSGAEPTFSVVVAGTAQAAISTGAMVAGTSYKIVGAYEANDFAVSRNAGTVGTDTSGTVPVVTQAEIGMLAGTSVGTQTISKLAYYPLRVTNAQLQGLTS